MRTNTTSGAQSAARILALFITIPLAISTIVWWGWIAVLALVVLIFSTIIYYKEELTLRQATCIILFLTAVAGVGVFFWQ